MKKTQKQKIEIEIEKPLSITCNMCGKSYTYKDEYFAHDITTINVQFGYGSKVDMENWEFDLCDDCLEKIVDKFIYKPKVK